MNSFLPLTRDDGDLLIQPVLWRVRPKGIMLNPQLSDQEFNVPSPIYVGINGNVFCLDRNTGQGIWESELAGSDFVTVLVDDDRVIAATHGEAFALDAATGKVLWNNRMHGQGYGLISLGTATQSSNPTPPAEDERRRRAEASRSAASR